MVEYGFSVDMENWNIYEYLIMTQNHDIKHRPFETNQSYLTTTTILFWWWKIATKYISSLL